MWVGCSLGGASFVSPLHWCEIACQCHSNPVYVSFVMEAGALSMSLEQLDEQLDELFFHLV